MTPDFALCSVVVDEMTLNEEVPYNKERYEVEGLEDFGEGVKTKFEASHATVFILRGLLDHWNQLAGYFLSIEPVDSERMHSHLLECIDKAEAAGLKVKA